MKLESKCPKCQKSIYLTTSDSDRAQLSMSKGKIIEVKCNSCSELSQIHVNEFSAVESKFAMLMALIAFVLGSTIMVYVALNFAFDFGNIYAIAGVISVIGIPFMIYSVFEKEQRNKIRQFNNYRVSE